MNVEISYIEINRLISEKIALPITLSYGSNGLLCVRYQFTTKVFSKEIVSYLTLNMSVASVHSDSFDLKINNFRSNILKLISPLINRIAKKYNVTFMSITSTGTLMVRLDKISALNTVLKKVRLDSLSFRSSEIGVGLDLKYS